MHQLKQLRHRIGFCDCEHLWLWAFEAAAWHVVSIARWTRDPMAPNCKRKNGRACQFNRTRRSRSKMVKAKAWIDALNLNFSCEGQLCWVGLATHLQSVKAKILLAVEEVSRSLQQKLTKLYQNWHTILLYTRPARPLLLNLSAPKCKPFRQPTGAESIAKVSPKNTFRVTSWEMLNMVNQTRYGRHKLFGI